jgi:starch phosphorylase
MRIRQEILLGIGGVRLLKALGIKPNVVHMNEGHSAFAGLERIKQLREEQGLSFDQAMQVVAASNCFTTHTPVPAGNDYFDPELVKRHFQAYVGGLGISMPVLLGYGRTQPRDQQEAFCMTVLALRMSAYNNGVSLLHGKVSRGMWKDVWPRFPEQDVPIRHITNGVHIPSYASNDMAMLYQRYLGPAWNEEYDSQAVWQKVDHIPDAELWRVHSQRRARLVAFVRQQLAEQLTRRGASSERLHQASEVLNSEALTIVFARRFATYKRAVLLLRDPERLARILGDPDRPVQIIFAGKAHPKDDEGKEYIRQVVAMSQDPRFAQKVVFLENYDINVARYLVQGADVWLNNPRRPLEACGTSGMKAAANGCLNLSILDGWWVEGYEPGLGWAIGSGEEYQDEAMQDRIEASALYRLLEDEVVPLFYDRGENHLPRKWIGYMKHCLAKVCPAFNSHRQVEDYTEQAYAPLALSFNSLTGQGYEPAKQLGDWVNRIMEHWSQVEVLEVNCSDQGPLIWNQELEVTARVRLGALMPDDVACDIYFGPLGADGGYLGRETQAMQPAGDEGGGVHVFKGRIASKHTGRMGLNLRVVPSHPHLSSKHALKLVVWG